MREGPNLTSVKVGGTETKSKPQQGMRVLAPSRRVARNTRGTWERG